MPRLPASRPLGVARHLHPHSPHSSHWDSLDISELMLYIFTKITTSNGNSTTICTRSDSLSSNLVLCWNGSETQCGRHDTPLGLLRWSIGADATATHEALIIRYNYKNMNFYEWVYTWCILFLLNSTGTARASPHSYVRESSPEKLTCRAPSPRCYPSCS